MDIEELAAQAAQLRRGRTLLFVATAGALLAVLGTMANKPVLSVVGWVTAILGGLGGISESARALGTPAVVKFAGMLGALMPVLNLPLLAGFAWHSHRGLAELDDTLRRETAHTRRAQRTAEPDAQRAQRAAVPEARHAQRAAEPSSARPGAAPPAAARPVPTPTRASARQAVACVKQVLETAAADQWCSANIQTGGAPGLPATLPADSQPLARFCGGHFVVFYLIDDGQHFHYATPNDLATAGLTPDQLHAIGVRNLEALVEGKPGLRSGRNGAFNALLLEGHFEASLVVLDALWDGPLAKLAPNGAVVAIPARDICAFCDARSPEGIEQLRALAKKVSTTGDHPITPRLLRRTGGRWALLPG